MEYFAASAYLISTGCKFNSCLNLSYNLIKQSLVEVLSMTSSRHVVPTYTKTSMILQYRYYESVGLVRPAVSTDKSTHKHRTRQNGNFTLRLICRFQVQILETFSIVFSDITDK